MNLATWIIWFALGLVPATAWMAWSRVVRVKRWPACALAVAILTGTVGSLLWYSLWAKPTPVGVAIVSPRSGEDLSGDRIRITGTLTPARGTVTVAIRAKSDPRWWVQRVVRLRETAADTGTWTVEGHLGTDTEGIGEEFYLIGLGSADGVLFNALTGRAAWEGMKGPHLPKWSQSSAVVVRRVK